MVGLPSGPRGMGGDIGEVQKWLQGCRNGSGNGCGDGCEDGCRDVGMDEGMGVGTDAGLDVGLCPSPSPAHGKLQPHPVPGVHAAPG